MRKRIVKQQELRATDAKVDKVSTERSPYRDYVESEGEESFLANPDLLPEPVIIQSDELEAILEVLNEGGLQVLSPREQEAFQLGVVEELPEREGADKMNVSRGAFRRYVERGAKKLKNLCRPKLG